MEWDRDYTEWEPEHRHVSHLYGLHPASGIDPDRTPELAAAARRTLEVRTDNGTGWSLAWKINFWARLRDAERAYRLIGRFFNPVPAERVDLDYPGGIYPNLLCAHPPFQIDGNFGYTAGVAEMLLQSHSPLDSPGAYELHLLPALPGAWANGNVSGLRARGGVTVAMRWRDARLDEVRLISDSQTSLAIRLGERRVVLPVTPGHPVILDGSLRLAVV
jgi:alpha-L-fucosidase 2